MKLKGKIAVVTGGGSGIGAGICAGFAKEGALTVITDMNLKKAEEVRSMISKYSSDAEARSLDVTSIPEVERVTDEIASKFGGIDIWVNCAGVSYVVPFLECTEELWDKTISVNLKGAFNCCKAAIRHMLPRRHGAIINMSSQSGKVGNSHYAAYCASKFGIIGLTQSLAIEFAKQNIRVNALCPGVVFTPMWNDMITDYADKRDMKPDEVRPYLENKIPMGRLCEVEDVARAVVFLAGEDSSYITGQSLNISGGVVMN